MVAPSCSICALAPDARKKLELLVGTYTYEEIERIAELLGIPATKSSMNRHKQSGHIREDVFNLETAVETMFARWWSGKPKDFVPSDTEMRQMLTLYLKSQSTKKREDKDKTRRFAEVFGGIAQPLGDG